MFGRSQPAAEPPAEPDAAPDVPESQAPKGRPTPSRREAEQNRKKNLKVPADPKAAKKAMKQREREARAEARAGLMAGDERYLPARDQGPAKALVRDAIDGRRRMAEYFVFVAVGILIAAFIGGQAQGAISLIWFTITIIVAAEVVIVMARISSQLKDKWPDKADRKGCMPYGALRMLQIRKLRIPPPKVRPGGAPVDPKR